MTNNCCGCFPPITEYNASNACQQPTLLQQVNYLTELLKKYPSQQSFISTDKVNEETIKITTIKNDTNRQINAGDFIFANTEGGSTLVFIYTGATDKDGKYIVDYVGVYGVSMDEIQKTYDKASQALELAQTNEHDISLVETRITKLEAEASIEVTLTPAGAKSGTLTQEQYNTLVTNDNCYIKLNEVVYTLSKNSATGVLIYSSKYLSDSKTMRTITVTKSTKAWVMTEVAISGGSKIFRNIISLFSSDLDKTITIYGISSKEYNTSSLSTPEDLYTYFYEKALFGKEATDSDTGEILSLGFGSQGLYVKGSANDIYICNPVEGTWENNFYIESINNYEL